jgi:hypothetical protein
MAPLDIQPADDAPPGYIVFACWKELENRQRWDIRKLLARHGCPRGHGARPTSYGASTQAHGTDFQHERRALRGLGDWERPIVSLDTDRSEPLMLMDDISYLVSGSNARPCSTQQRISSISSAAQRCRMILAHSIELHVRGTIWRSTRDEIEVDKVRINMLARRRGRNSDTWDKAVE